jgi:hypothetical protein
VAVVSIETTEAQAAARQAEQAWKWHKPGCPSCSSRRRVPKCAVGDRLYREATQLRADAQALSAADKAPGPGDAALFDLATVTFNCEHAAQIEIMPGGYEPKRGKWLTCSRCQGQRRIISVSAGQGSAG